MTQVIYADVLVVINFYITYILLKTTAFFCTRKPKTKGLLLSCFIGGFYSLIILIPNISDLAVSLSRIPVCIVFILLCFGFHDKISFLKISLCFVFCNFLFAGLMFALWYFIYPAGMYFNGSVLYLSIDTLTLTVLTAVCYFVIKLFDLLLKKRKPDGTLFHCILTLKGKEYPLKAFYDTGNSFSDPFSGKGISIVSREALKEAFPTMPGVDTACLYAEYKFRFLPCSTALGEGLLPVFTAEKLHIKGANKEETFCDVLIAVTDKKIFGGEYDLLLSGGIFENTRKGEENEKVKELLFKN